MIDAEEVTQFKTIVEQSQTFLILMGADLSADHAATALSLYAALQSAGKDVSILAPKAPEFSKDIFVGLENIQTELGNKNLTVSFEYDERSVDKVSYHIGEETGRFILTIKPQKGQKPLAADQVDFSYTGAEADCLIVVGVSRLEQLGSLYIGYEQFFADTTIVAIHSYSPEYGQLCLNTSGRPSMSETLIPVFEQLRMEVTGDVATMLLYAIEVVTKNFQSLSVTAETFEVVAKLLRMGARRIRDEQVGRDTVIDAEVLQDQTMELVHRMPSAGKKSTKNGEKKKQQVQGGLDFQPSAGLAKS